MNVTRWMLILAVLGPGRAPASEFYHDFRGGKPLPPELKLFGPNVGQAVVPEPEGLRVRTPTEGKITGGWGVALQYVFSGDFEVTGTYELLTLERPENGVGAGVALNALPSLGGRKFAKAGRFQLVAGVDVFVAEFLNKDQPRGNQWNSVPAATQAGQLRLTRKGTVMHYLVTDAIGGEFREIAAWEFGPEDLSMVRFIANNNGSQTAVDARLLDLRVAGNLKSFAAAEPKPGWALAIALGIIVTVLLVAAGVRLLARRRGSPAAADTAGGPASPS